jgi:hypothetical protein
VTLGDRSETPAQVRGLLAASVGLPGGEPAMDELVAAFDPDALPEEPWVFA